MTEKDVVNYWLSSAYKDYKAMISLYNNRHYVWSLFLGHIVLEKLLKAFYVKNIDVNVPYTHDLTKLAQKAGLSLTEEQKDFLDEVTAFNIRARYPDYKKRFYRKATGKFAEVYIIKIKDFRKWFVKKIKA